MTDSEDDFIVALKKLRAADTGCRELALMPGLGVIGCMWPRGHTGDHQARVGGKLVEWKDDGIVYEVQPP